MTKPRLLDLYCGAGGASLGYHRAGFEVVGVDNKFMRRYPFEFHEEDALEFLVAHGHEFDAIHASPPCHYASAGTRALDWQNYPNLVRPTRLLLEDYNVPWVIENVEGAALIDPLWLCGTEFGLQAVDTDGTPLELWRHRGFESNIQLAGAGGCRHFQHAEQVAGVYKGARRDKALARQNGGGYVPAKSVQSALMGITWMSERELHQAIPPVYSQHLGAQLMAKISVAA